MQYRERRWKRNRLEYIVRSEINEIEERIRRRGATESSFEELRFKEELKKKVMRGIKKIFYHL